MYKVLGQRAGGDDETEFLGAGPGGSPTGGTFTLTFQGQTTPPLAFPFNRDAVQAAMEGLSTIGAGNMAVSIDAFGGALYFEFIAAMGGRKQPALEVDSSSLVGGDLEITQPYPGGFALNELYATPPGYGAVCSTLVVCNMNAYDVHFGIAVHSSNGPGGAYAGNYIAHNVVLAANTFTTLTIGITLNAGDTVSVESDSAGTNFHLFGTEVPQTTPPGPGF